MRQLRTVNYYYIPICIIIFLSIEYVSSKSIVGFTENILENEKKYALLFIKILLTNKASFDNVPKDKKTPDTITVTSSERKEEKRVTGKLISKRQINTAYSSWNPYVSTNASNSRSPHNGNSNSYYTLQNHTQPSYNLAIHNTSRNVVNQPLYPNLSSNTIPFSNVHSQQWNPTPAYPGYNPVSSRPPYQILSNNNRVAYNYSNNYSHAPGASGPVKSNNPYINIHSTNSTFNSGYHLNIDTRTQYNPNSNYSSSATATSSTQYKNNYNSIRSPQNTTYRSFPFNNQRNNTYQGLSNFNVAQPNINRNNVFTNSTYRFNNVSNSTQQGINNIPPNHNNQNWQPNYPHGYNNNNHQNFPSSQQTGNNMYPQSSNLNYNPIEGLVLNGYHPPQTNNNNNYNHNYYLNPSSYNNNQYPSYTATGSSSLNQYARHNTSSYYDPRKNLPSQFSYSH